ncbi:MAG: hypothetical protein IK130_09900 [Oscillospiraceae bacterium]|nr:hypothetical protein [Oscillospiraceae bacterium]
MKKKVLLIAPLFFDYYKDMMDELRMMGYDADYICDAPSNSNLSKAAGRINKDLIKRSTEKYFSESVLPRISAETYDYVLVVAGMTFAFDADMMRIIRKKQENAKFCMYQWDSEKNLPYSTGIHPFFDSLFTFDRFDAERDSKYHFLPLFYNRTFEAIGSSPARRTRVDCFYVGTAHPKKYQEVNEMANALKDQLPRQFIYHYMPSKLKYFYHKVLAPEFRHAKLSGFQTEKLSKDQIANIMSVTKCVLDAPQAGQTGLTIRTIECLGAKRKLITTNSDIANYDFYRPENILIFDGNVDFNGPFFTSPYVEPDKDVYEAYSLRSWLKSILG